MKKISKRVLCLMGAMLILFSLMSFSCAAAVIPSDEGFVVVGDANSDNSVNIIDLVRIKKSLANLDAEIEVSVTAVDFDQSGEVEGNDLVSLRKLLLGSLVDETVWSDGIY